MPPHHAVAVVINLFSSCETSPASALQMCTTHRAHLFFCHKETNDDWKLDVHSSSPSAIFIALWQSGMHPFSSQSWFNTRWRGLAQAFWYPLWLASHQARSTWTWSGLSITGRHIITACRLGYYKTFIFCACFMCPCLQLLFNVYTFNFQMQRFCLTTAFGFSIFHMFIKFLGFDLFQ